MLDLNAETIDLRDVTDRVDELREVATVDDEELDEEDYQQLHDLEALLEQLAGNGGDHDWDGDWYPLTLIRDDYMQSYAKETAEDCGMINKNAEWPNNCIDWDMATEQFKQDYSDIEIDGITYWYR